MTDEELTGIAAQAFNMARLDIKRGEGFSCLIAGYFDDTKLHRMTKVEATIIERLGADWLDSGAAKDAAFDIMRLACDVMPPDAVVFACSMNFFEPTAKLDALPRGERYKILEGGHDGHHAAVALGLLTVRDALNVTAQTPERVCIYTQAVDVHGEPVEKPQVQLFPQETFGGRMKMFGDRAQQRMGFERGTDAAAAR